MEAACSQQFDGVVALVRRLQIFQVMQGLDGLLLREGDFCKLQVGVCMCGLDSQNVDKCASGLSVLSPRNVMVAEVVPQTSGARRQVQRPLVEWLCLLIFLLRV